MRHHSQDIVPGRYHLSYNPAESKGKLALEVVEVRRKDL
ncbi:4HBT domain-containing protein [Psidium guajava]|nr:4HBT domain-containing protein [Psidium guajava]